MAAKRTIGDQLANWLDWITRGLLFATGLLYAIGKGLMLFEVQDPSTLPSWMKFMADNGEHVLLIMFATAAVQVLFIAFRVKELKGRADDLEREIKLVGATCLEIKADHTVMTLLDKFDDELDPEINKLLSAQVKNQVDALRAISVEKKLVVLDRHEFSTIYIASFRNYPGCTVRSTSLANEGYFWYSDRVHKPTEELPSEVALRKFCADGGTVERLFYVGHDWRNNDYTMGVLERQKRYKVKVYVAEVAQPYAELLYVHFVEPRIGWEADAPGGILRKFTFTRNAADLDKYDQSFGRWRDSGRWVEF